MFKKKSDNIWYHVQPLAEEFIKRKPLHIQNQTQAKWTEKTIRF